MSFDCVVTHDATFHADEVFAVAMLKYAGHTFKIIRTRNHNLLERFRYVSDTLLLDVGGYYEPELLNFDHHQDKNLQSAAGLIYEHFKDKICPVEFQPYFSEFISAIDLIDTNRNNIYETWATLPAGFRNVSNIISGFNRDIRDEDNQRYQFSRAVDFATTILANEIYSASKKAKSESDYKNRVILPNNIAVFDEYSAIWKDKKDHLMAVMPAANGWQINSRDTALAQIPESVSECEGFIFRHASGFMAVVKEKSVAVEFASTFTQM